MKKNFFALISAILLSLVMISCGKVSGKKVRDYTRENFTGYITTIKVRTIFNPDPEIFVRSLNATFNRESRELKIIGRACISNLLSADTCAIVIDSPTFSFPFGGEVTIENATAGTQEKYVFYDQKESAEFIGGRKD